MTQEMHILVYIGLLFLAGQVGGRIAVRLGAPRLIGYLITGVVLGPSQLGVFSEALINLKLGLFTDIALAVIAFSIGRALRLEKLKKLKSVILWITLGQASMASIVVFIMSLIFLPMIVPGYAFQSYTVVALILGAISAATAPAAILSILHESHAKGPFTTVLLGVVALDDIITLLFYAFATAISMRLLGNGEAHLIVSIGSTIFAILLAILIGALMGGVITKALKFFAPRELMLGFMLGVIMLTSGIAMTLDVSPLLAVMIMAGVITNFSDHKMAEEAFDVVETIEEPIFSVFFVLAGTHLNLGVAFAASSLAVVLLLSRFLGKLLGTWMGGTVSHAPLIIKRYLGIALLPAAGITMGLVMDAQILLGNELPHLTELMVSGVVGAVLINELLTPFCVRFALAKASDST